MILWVLLRQPKSTVLEVYGPFWSQIAAMDAAIARWGNDPKVVLAPLDDSLSGTVGQRELK